MNDDDRIDALLRSGASAFPPAPAPDAAHLRSVVTTSRRRTNRTRGTVLVGASALVAGGALLTVRPGDDEVGPAGVVSATSAPPTAPPTSEVWAGLPDDLVDVLCNFVPPDSFAPVLGDDTSVVWFDGFSERLDDVTIFVDGEVFFAGVAVASNLAHPPAGEAPIERPAAVEGGDAGEPIEWGTDDLTELDRGFVVGVTNGIAGGFSLYFLGPETDAPHELTVDAISLEEPLTVTLDAGEGAVLEADGSVTTFDPGTMSRHCDDVATTQPDTTVVPDAGDDPADGSDTTAPATTATTSSTTDPMPSTTTPSDPAMVTTTALPPSVLTTVTTTGADGQQDPAASTTWTLPPEQVAD